MEDPTRANPLKRIGTPGMPLFHRSRRSPGRKITGSWGCIPRNGQDQFTSGQVFIDHQAFFPAMCGGFIFAQHFRDLAVVPVLKKSIDFRHVFGLPAIHQALIDQKESVQVGAQFRIRVNKAESSVFEQVFRFLLGATFHRGQGFPGLCQSGAKHAMGGIMSDWCIQLAGQHDMTQLK